MLSTSRKLLVEIRYFTVLLCESKHHEQIWLWHFNVVMTNQMEDQTKRRNWIHKSKYHHNLQFFHHVFDWLSLARQSAYKPSGPSGQSPYHEATESISTPPWIGCYSIAGLRPSIKFASTHLYTCVERGTVRVKCLSQEQCARPKQCARPGLKPGILDPETSALTMMPPRLPQDSNIPKILLVFSDSHSK